MKDLTCIEDLRKLAQRKVPGAADPNSRLPSTLMISAGKLEISDDRRNLITILTSGVINAFCGLAANRH
jgi:hypothetical protein